MNILIVCDYAHVSGGAAKVAIESALGLRARGHTVSYLAGVGPVDPRLNAAGIEATALYSKRPENNLKWVKQGLWNDAAEAAMRDTLRVHAPETPLVHVHSFRDALTASIFKPIFERQAALVHTAHDYGLACPYGGFFDYRENAICQRTGLSAACWTARCNDGSYLKKLWFNVKNTAQRPYVPSQLRHLVTISDLEERVLEPYLPDSCVRYRVDNPAVSAKPPCRIVKEDAPFIFVGALVPHKDPLTAAKAALQAGQRIVFAGFGPLEREVQSLAASAPAGAIEFLGWLEDDVVATAVSHARALIFPSIWYEGQPLTVLEAMSQGCPVIASDASAARESIHRYGGTLFKPGDVNALSALMKTHSGHHLERISKDTYERFWNDPPTLEKHVAALEQVYQSALDEPR